MAGLTWISTMVDRFLLLFIVAVATLSVVGRFYPEAITKAFDAGGW